MLKKFLLAVVTIAVATGVVTEARAEVTFGGSTAALLAAELYVDVQRNTSVVHLTDTAPPAYSSSLGPTGLFGFGNPYLFISGDDASASISSNVDGTLGSKTTSANLEAINVEFTMTDLLSITFAELEADASVSGDFGTLEALRTTTVNLATLTVLGSSVDLDFGEVYNQDGLTITFFDRGTTEEDGFATAHTNLFLLNFDDFEHDGEIYNGFVKIGHLEATQQAVPEPASALILGALGAATALRRKRRIS